MSLLLQGGTVLIHDDKDKVTPTKTNILIEGDRITVIGNDIAPPDGCEIINCTNKIISPGFIDTHHHLWEAPLKGLYGDAAFVPYLAIMFAASHYLSPDDLFWSQLGGSLQSIDAGTTTVLDHAHLNWTPQHSPAALAGLISSGLRSIFAYTPTLGLEQTVPEIAFNSNAMAPWVMEVLEKLATTEHMTNVNSCVKLGLGFDFYYLPQDVIKGIFDKARSLGVEIITSHFNRFWGKEAEGIPTKLKNMGALDERIVLSHAGGATPADIQTLKEAKAFVSVTPNTEQAMTVGPSVVFRNDLDADSICSLGIDCSSFTNSSIVNEMRTGLQTARAFDSVAHHDRVSLPNGVFHTVADAFNLGTIQGARALCMERDIGSIQVGKKADLVIFDALSPPMINAAQHDPVMAIVLHSGIGDVETVIIDGKIRKRDGKLLPVKLVEWRDETAFVDTTKSVSWSDVGGHLLDIQKKFLSDLSEVDLGNLEEHSKALLHLPGCKSA